MENTHLVRGAVGLDQTLLVDDWQAFLADSRWVVALVSQIEAFEPFVNVADHFSRLVFRYYVLNDAIAVANKVCMMIRKYFVTFVIAMTNTPSRKSP